MTQASKITISEAGRLTVPEHPIIPYIEGDGIGPEVMAEVRKVIDWYGAKRDLAFDVSEGLVGGASYDAHGTPLTDATMAKAQEVDAGHGRIEQRTCWLSRDLSWIENSDKWCALAGIAMVRSIPHEHEHKAEAHRIAQDAMTAVAEALTQLMERHRESLAGSETTSNTH